MNSEILKLSFVGRFRGWKILSLLLALVCSAEGHEPTLEGQMVIVQLESEAVCNPGTIELRDIARIWATDKELEQKAGSLQLADLSTESKWTLSLEELRERLREHGLPSDIVQVVGPERMEVTVREVSPEDVLALAIRDAVATRWNASPEDITVELHLPTTKTVPQLLVNESWKIEVPDASKPGRMALRALRLKGSIVMRNLPVNATISVYGDVAVAAASLPQKRTLQADDVRIERRALNSLDDRWTDSDWVGKSTKQALQAGQIVRVQFLSDEIAPTNEIVVQARSVVRLSARKGNLCVTAAGVEAMQSGRLGDWIRVRNPQSGKIITGRVTGPGEVEVPF